MRRCVDGMEGKFKRGSFKDPSPERSRYPEFILGGGPNSLEVDHAWMQQADVHTVHVAHISYCERQQS